jgi:hypothetical protein
MILATDLFIPFYLSSVADGALSTTACRLAESILFGPCLRARGGPASTLSTARLRVQWTLRVRAGQMEQRSCAHSHSTFRLQGA